MTTPITTQIADDHGHGDYTDRVVLADGSLAFVGKENPLTGVILAYHVKECCDYGGNVLGSITADQNSIGLCRFRCPTVVSFSGPVARLIYVGPTSDCTGRSRYKVSPLLHEGKEL